MRIELKRLHQSLAATIIYVTLDQIEAMTLATRIAVSGPAGSSNTPRRMCSMNDRKPCLSWASRPGMNFLSGSIARGTVPVARIETDAIPLDGYPPRTSLGDNREIIFGIRPEHVSLANHETRGLVIEAETLFTEPMGADTLGWFQYGSQRISARLTPQRARGLSGQGASLARHRPGSLFDPMTEQRL
jgi:multiple sugar transport system ATP-binding protein